MTRKVRNPMFPGPKAYHKKVQEARVFGRIEWMSAKEMHERYPLPGECGLPNVAVNPHAVVYTDGRWWEDKAPEGE